MIREALPVVMEDLVRSAPPEQKEKILKLVNIWERGQTFPASVLADMKRQLNGEANSKLFRGSSKLNLTVDFLDAQNIAAVQKNSQSMEQAYTAQTNSQAIAPPAQPPIPQDPSALYAALTNFGQQNSQTNGAPAAPPVPAFMQNMVPPPPPGFVPPPPPAAVAPSSALPVVPNGADPLTAQILQAMSSGLIAPDQAIQVLSAMASAQGSAPPSLQLPTAPQSQAQAHVQPISQNNMQQKRYEQGDNGQRDRSRSPDYDRRQSPQKSPPNPNRRASPTYGVYDPSSGDGTPGQFDRGDRGRGRGKQRGNDRNDYRQRSPPRRQASPHNTYGNSKFIDWDDSLPRDHIRVLSRTLFVGGAGGSEGEIREIFSRFGQVQTCIVNSEKRHAFVKMMTRPHAVAAKQGMDALQDPVAQSKARQVRNSIFLVIIN